MKKNIWIFNHYAKDMLKDKGGRHYWFAENLIKNGYSVTIFAATSSHSHRNIDNVDTGKKKFLIVADNDIPYILVKTPSYNSNGMKRIINMISFYRNLFPASKEYAKKCGKPDVILASSVHPLTLVAGIKIAKSFRIPCICEVRDLWPESLVAYGQLKKNSIIAKVLYMGEKWIYKKADKLIFTMEGGKDYIIEKGWDKDNGGSINLNKVYHINNGIDIRQFNFNKINYTIQDSDLINDDYYKVVYTGSLRQGNDSIWKLIYAAPLIEKVDSKIKFLIYGDGDQKEKIENYCKEKQIGNVCIKGNVEKKYIPYILSRCNLNILNCSSWSVLKYGGSQNKLFEYLASGHPIISGEESKYSIISQYNCGISRTFKDAEDLKNTILEFKNMDNSTLTNMQKNILSVAQEYDYRNLTRKLMNIIESDEV